MGVPPTAARRELQVLLQQHPRVLRCVVGDSGRPDLPDGIAMVELAGRAWDVEPDELVAWLGDRSDHRPSAIFLVSSLDRPDRALALARDALT